MASTPSAAAGSVPASIPSSISDAMARLWAKFLPEIENRVALIETAAGALVAGELTEQQRDAAHQAAHKLAGVLGTFGLHRGTDVARQAELLLAESPSRDAAGELSAAAEELRLMVRGSA